MARVGSDLFSNRQSVDVAGSAYSGLKMRDLMDQRKENNAIKDSYTKNVVTNPDGTTSVNKKGVIADLYKINPAKAMEAERAFQIQDRENEKFNFEKMNRELNLTGQLLGGVKDQASWENALVEAQKAGLDVSQLSKAYDPGIVRNLQMRTMSAQEQLAMQQKDRGLDLQERELGIRAGEKLEAKQEKLVKSKEKNKEFDERYNNIKTAISDLQRKVKDKGTYEAFGSHEKDLATLIDSIAIDSAKMFDPQSVARESEVAAFRNMLFEPGALTTRNSTAKDILSNYEKMLDKRASVIRGGQPIIGDQGPVQDIASILKMDFTKMQDGDLDALYKKLGGK